jgi:glycosyltransferase involved in cell wall biosynthesis
MSLNIDLTDVAAHAIFNDDLTGIQRVQIEYTKALARLCKGNSNVFSNVHNLYHDLNSLFDKGAPSATSEIFGDIRGLYGLPLPGKLTLRNGADIRANALLKLKLARRALLPDRCASNLRLRTGDVLYVGGAFWAHARSIQTYEQAAFDGCDVVVLFHDFIPITFPGLTNGRARPLFERMLRLPARTVTISQHTKSQLEEARSAVGAPPLLQPPTVVPLAHEFSAAPRNHMAPEAPSVRTAALHRLGPFALCVGTVEIRKNHSRLLHLWESLAREWGEAWPKLVIAGKRGWRADETLRVLRRADDESPYLWIEAPTDEELVWLYGRASFTVFPSLAEGWGMPIGESLWFGKPCVASNTTSMPEVGGDLCFYGDPHDIDSFAAPIIKLVRDSEFYANAVAAIKARPLRTWAEAANDIAASLSGFADRERGARSLRMRTPQGQSDTRECPPPDDRIPAPV